MFSFTYFKIVSLYGGFYRFFFFFLQHLGLIKKLETYQECARTDAEI